jgi:hypothetical protein
VIGSEAGVGGAAVPVDVGSDCAKAD